MTTVGTLYSSAARTTALDSIGGNSFDSTIPGLLQQAIVAVGNNGGGGGGGSTAWGAITGTLSSQTDLQAALDAKVTAAGGSIANTVDLNASMFTALNTKVALTGDAMTGLLQFTGTTHAGLRLNNLTTVQRDAIASPQAGMAIWNTTAARLQLHNGSAWTAGMVRLDGDTMTGALTIPVGSAAATSLNFGTAGTGIYSASAAASVDIAIAGTRRYTFDGAYLSTNGAGITVIGGNYIGGNTYLRQDGPALRMGASDDVAIGRDGAAETLALGRRNASANTLRIYGTWTDTSNYVRLALTTTSTTMGIVCQTAGTGADDIDLGLTPAGAGLVAFSNAASADAAVVSTHSARVKFNGTEYKVLLATP